MIAGSVFLSGLALFTRTSTATARKSTRKIPPNADPTATGTTLDAPVLLAPEPGAAAAGVVATEDVTVVAVGVVGVVTLLLPPLLLAMVIEEVVEVDVVVGVVDVAKKLKGTTRTGDALLTVVLSPKRPNKLTPKQ